VTEVLQSANSYSIAWGYEMFHYLSFQLGICQPFYVDSFQSPDMKKLAPTIFSWSQFSHYPKETINVRFLGTKVNVRPFDLMDFSPFCGHSRLKLVRTINFGRLEEGVAVNLLLPSWFN
jgi:hypothetical protein